MPDLVRDRLYLGDINDAAKIMQHGTDEITHVLSILSSSSISFFTEWRKDIVIPSKEVRKIRSGKVVYSLEKAGKDLKFVRMAIALKDIESENLLDYLDVCLDFIDRSRQEGSILVHCFAGISRSATVVTAYLMRSERLFVQDALQSLRRSRSVYPNAGFLEQLQVFKEMGFKLDYASPIYKRFRFKKLLGKVPTNGSSAVVLAVISIFCGVLLVYHSIGLL